ncbi:MAG: glycosyltransferase family 2 protein [Micromonosporaceae bacterium]|jgi:glycosyltransferase involved in cell wall biosynthesis|nr:glycosyltransferase family 2 protein [Micromonosporaceae bacterium]
MYKGRRIAAVVPAYNESKLIVTTITTMPDFVDLIVVVNDCSTDDTSKRARSVEDPRVVVIDHEVNTGVGGAIIDGHQEALRRGSDVNVVMAGDAQMDPAYLPTLLDPICDDGYEFTKANRFFSRTSFASMPKLRMLGSIALSFATKVASGYWNLFDPQNGYTAITRAALLRLDLSRVARGYEFENDLLIWLNIANVRAKDVPIPAVYGEEVSSMRIHRAAAAIASLLLRGFWRRMLLKHVLASFSPVALLFFTGLFLVLAGLGWGVWVLIETIGPPVATTGSVLLSVGPLLTGIHMLISALTLDIQSTPD